MLAKCFDKRNMKLIVDWGKGIYSVFFFYCIQIQTKKKRDMYYMFIYMIVLCFKATLNVSTLNGKLKVLTSLI